MVDGEEKEPQKSQRYGDGSNLSPLENESFEEGSVS